MTDKDFDFDFDVGRGAPGTREDPEPRRDERRPGANGDGRTGRARSGSARAARPRRRPEGRRPSPGGDRSGGDPGEDWLSLTDDELSRRDLTSIATPDDGPAGPRRLGEGR
ncbi:MAG TPA: hypothetical protein VFN15_02530, partial [Solirubrobacterales bacterium]|nr:hypothetical protein [Solirubrobacterales bacterium]